MGTVYRAHDTVLDRDVAVKVLSQLNLGAEGREKLLREARAIAKLNHPNIVAVHDAGEADGIPFIVMELVEGKNLHERPPNDLVDLVRVASQVCAALEHAHSNGIVHRDLKPENVIIDSQEVVKLMDFGIARSMTTRLTSEGEIVGTVFYIAPEIALGQDFDGRADLYSLGVMLYELTTGELPFAQGDPLAVISQHLHASLVPPRAKDPQIPPRLDDLIVQLMNKSPKDRPSSAAEVRRSLERQNLLDAEAEELPEISVIRRIVRGRFVGREQELLEARAVWNKALAGEGQTLLISGAPGVGKTRLMRELATHVEVTGGTTLVGECEAEGGAPYAPFAQVMRRALRQGSEDGLDVPEFVLSDLLKLAPELKPYYPDVSANPPLEPEAEQQRLFENVVAFCQVLSDRGPLLLVIDDAHWADSGSLALLRHLARRTRRQRTLLVATYRELELEEARPFHETLLELNRRRLGTRLKLKPLTEDQTRDMLAAIFEEAITPEFLEGIYRETEGNPFFIEEVCKALVEEGKLHFEDGRWHRPSMEELEIPQSVRLAIQSRIAKLPAECQETLNLAAVMGREFDFDTLVEASSLGEDVLISALEAAEQAQLIEEVRSVGGVTFSFVHALISGTIAESVHTLRRRKLHRQVAGAIEALRPEDSDALAYHYGEAGDEERALEFHLLAGRRSAGAYTHREAEGHFRRALELHPSTAGEAELLTQLGEALSRQGKHSEAIAAWRSALLSHESLANVRDMARCYARMGRTQWNAGDSRGALDICLEGMAVLKGSPASSELAALVHETARAHHFIGMPDEARPLCLLALEMARQVAATEVQADVLATLGVLPDQSFDEAIGHLQSAIALSREHGLPYHEARARNNLGVVLFDGPGDPRASLDQDLINIEIARNKTRDIGQEVLSLCNAAWGLIELGELGAADEMVSQLRGLGDQLVDPGLSAREIRLVQSSLRWARGEWEETLQQWSMDWTEALEKRPWEVFGTGLRLARLLFDLGEFSQASGVLQEVIEAADQARFGRVHSRALSVAVYAKLNDAKRAKSLLEEARAFQAQSKFAVGRLALTLAEAYVLLAEDRWDETWSAFRSAVESYGQAGLRWRRARTLREWAAAHLAHGRPEDTHEARRLLEEARSEFEAMDAPGYVEKITRQLQEIPSE